MRETGDIGNSDRDDPDPLAILRLRAQARAALNDPDRLPIIVSQCGDDPQRAIMQVPEQPDREFFRHAGESIEDFTARVSAELPVRDESRSLWYENGGPGLGMFCITLLPARSL
jgi:hypothetical protein